LTLIEIILPCAKFQGLKCKLIHKSKVVNTLPLCFGQINNAANTALSEANDVANAVVIAEGYANAVWLLPLIF